MKFHIAQGKDEGSVVKPSPFDLVETYRNFWAREEAAAELRMKDPAILRAALRSMAAETQRQVPIPWQISIYGALLHAEIANRQFLADQSRRAGSAAKTDALQMFIIDVVRAHRSITHVQLLDKLRQAQQPGGLIEDIDDELISFVDGKGRGKTAQGSPFPGEKEVGSTNRKRVNRANPIPLTPSSNVLHTVQCGGAQMQRTFSPASVEYLPTGELIPYPRNARPHSKKQIKAIARSIERFGFTNPVLATSANEILAGHGRVEAAKLLGMSTVPVLRIDHLNEAERRAYVIADNRLAEKAGWDKEILEIELQSLVTLGFEVELTGFEVPEVDLILDAAAEKEQDPGPEDDLPDVRHDQPAVTRPGDL